jgi:hypothetical protein
MPDPGIIVNEPKREVVAGIEIHLDPVHGWFVFFPALVEAAIASTAMEGETLPAGTVLQWTRILCRELTTR